MLGWALGVTVEKHREVKNGVWVVVGGLPLPRCQGWHMPHTEVRVGMENIQLEPLPYEPIPVLGPECRSVW